MPLTQPYALSAPKRHAARSNLPFVLSSCFSVPFQDQDNNGGAPIEAYDPMADYPEGYGDGGASGGGGSQGTTQQSLTAGGDDDGTDDEGGGGSMKPSTRRSLTEVQRIAMYNHYLKATCLWREKASASQPGHEQYADFVNLFGAAQSNLRERNIPKVRDSRAK